MLVNSVWEGIMAARLVDDRAPRGDAALPLRVALYDTHGRGDSQTRFLT